jgi:hypothetical protein
MRKLRHIKGINEDILGALGLTDPNDMNDDDIKNIEDIVLDLLDDGWKINYNGSFHGDSYSMFGINSTYLRKSEKSKYIKILFKKIGRIRKVFNLNRFVIIVTSPTANHSMIENLDYSWSESKGRFVRNSNSYTEPMNSKIFTMFGQDKIEISLKLLRPITKYSTRRAIR